MCFSTVSSYMANHPSRFNRQRTLILIICGTLISLNLALAAVVWRLRPWNFLRVANIPLAEQRQSEKNSLLVVTLPPANSRAELGLMIFRPMDGRAETLTGTWQFVWLQPSILALFGSFPNQSGVQRLYLVTAKGSVALDISRLPGAIGNIRPNKNGSLMIVDGRRNQPRPGKKFYSCVLTDLKKGLCREAKELIPAKNYHSDASYALEWNPGADSELIITESSASPQRFVYHLSDRLATPTTSLAKTATTTGPNWALPQTRYAIKRYAWVTVIHDRRFNQKHYFILPPTARLIWVGQKTLLVINWPDSYLLNIFAREKSRLPPWPPSARAAATYYGTLPLD